MRSLWMVVGLLASSLPAWAEDNRPVLDAALVNRLVEQRVKTIGRRALAKALENLGDDIGRSAPIRDVAKALAGIIDQQTDPETRVRVLRDALLRAGLSVWAATEEAAKEEKGAKEKEEECSCPDREGMCGCRLEAAYEGLAASRLNEHLVFPEADGAICVPGGVDCGPDPIAKEEACDDFKKRTITKVKALYAKQLVGACAQALGQAVQEILRTPMDDLPEIKLDLEVCALALEQHTGRALTRTVACTQGLVRVGYVDEHIRPCLKALRASFDDVAARSLDALRDLSLHEKRCARVVEDLDCLLDHPAPTPPPELERLIRKALDGTDWSCPDYRLVVEAVLKALKDHPDEEFGIQGSVIMREVLEDLPYVLRCEAGAIELDVPGLANRLALRFDQESRPGFYLRATVGTGYLAGHATGMSPLIYEEIGVGFRIPALSYRLLWGPHIALSGVLHRMVLEDKARDATFVVLGQAFNWDGLLEISFGMGMFLAGVGGAGEGDEGDLQRQGLFVLGLHLPLADYVEAAAAALAD